VIKFNLHFDLDTESIWFAELVIIACFDGKRIASISTIVWFWERDFGDCLSSPHGMAYPPWVKLKDPGIAFGIEPATPWCLVFFEI
jgi:hypothetical protein